MNELTTNNNQQLEQRKGVNQETFNSYISYLDVSAKTIETYTKALRQLAKYLSDHNISQPTRADLLAFKKELEHSETINQYGEVEVIEHKPTTIQNYIVAIRLFFKWTEQEGIYPNIADHLKGEKLNREHKKDYLTAEQMKTILASMPRETEQDKRNYALVVLMVTGGLRTIEIVRANVEDLRTLGSNVVLYVQGKGKVDREDYIKIPKETEQAIRDYLKTRSKVSGNDPLFISTSNNSKGGRLTTRTIREVVKETFKANGYDSERLTAHSLRHTAVTLSLLGGMELADVQQFARHQNITTTMIYNHALDKAKNQCSQTISNAIFNN